MDGKFVIQDKQVRDMFCTTQFSCVVHFTFFKKGDLMLSILTKKKQNQNQSETKKLWCVMDVSITLTLTVLIVSKLRWNFTWKLPSNSEVYMEIQKAEDS